MIAELALLLFLLLAAHALCDFALQPAHVSTAKRPGGNASVPWLLAIGGHSLIHGGAVALLVLPYVGAADALALGIAETSLHAAIDISRCHRIIGTKTDQAAHVACKLLWVWIIAGSGALP